MKMISWNVNGIRAAWNHGLSTFLSETDADIYAFQETKASEPISMMELEGYYAYWSFCTRRKGYSGTLCLTRDKPIDVTYGIGDEAFDCEGRIITLEYETFYFVNCYVPNSQSSEARYDYRCEWDERLVTYLNRLRKRKPTVVCGDFNVPISDEDVYSENQRVKLNSEGFLSTERENLMDLLRKGYVDTYRMLHESEIGKYTWWSNRLNKRKENRGWRLDYFLVTENLCSKVIESTMLTDVGGSDHCPILLEMTDDEQDTPEDRKMEYKTTLRYKDLVGKDIRTYIKSIRYGDMTDLWNSIDWDQAEQNLANMQRALAKSAFRSQEDKMSYVYNLCETGYRIL